MGKLWKCTHGIIHFKLKIGIEKTWKEQQMSVILSR